jgi:predicted nucleic acid-binding Zn ribbon protein
MEISQNMFYIIIAIIVLVGVIIAIIQWRRVRKLNKDIEFLEKLTEQRKAEMFRGGQEPEETTNIVLPKAQEKNLAQIMQVISNLMNKKGCLPHQIDARFKSLESSTRTKKFQKLLWEIEE